MMATGRDGGTASIGEADLEHGADVDWSWGDVQGLVAVSWDDAGAPPIQPQLAPGGYNCSESLKMELAVTCISGQVITARYICLLLWRFLMSSCNQQ